MHEYDSVLRAVARDVIPALSGLFGDRLRSVVAYGSVVRGDYLPGVSDVNLLVVVDAASGRQLRALGQSGRRVLRRHRVTMLLLTTAELPAAADVFPMEYLDLQADGQVIHGGDLHGGLEVSKGHLRHQLEERLRGSLTTLRQLVVETRGRRRPLARRLDAWYGAQIALFRGILHLQGEQTVPLDPAELVASVGNHLQVDLSPQLELVRMRTAGTRATVTLADEVLESQAALIAAVDAIDAS